MNTNRSQLYYIVYSPTLRIAAVSMVRANADTLARQYSLRKGGTYTVTPFWGETR